MRLEVGDEYNALETAKKNLNEKLTNAFKGKWAIETRPNKLNGIPEIVRTKKGKLIVFKIDTCRPRSTALSDHNYMDELVLSGEDSLGTPRTITIQRSGLIKSRYSGKQHTNVNMDIYDYDVVIFESEEEALLYAELCSDNNK